jgi:hypothetical protein
VIHQKRVKLPPTNWVIRFTQNGLSYPNKLGDSIHPKWVYPTNWAVGSPK